MPASSRSFFAVFLFLFTAAAILAQVPQNEPYRVGGKVTRPEKIAGNPPVYTEADRNGGVEGIVIVEVVIDEKGDVVNSRIRKPLTPGLDQATLDAVEAWKFRPATLDGQPVKVYYTLTVNLMITGKVEGLAKTLGVFLNENPELQMLLLEEDLPGALAYLEDGPPTPGTHAGRGIVLAGLRRFDEAMTEARSYDGPAPEQLFQFISHTALTAKQDDGLATETRSKYFDEGIQAATEALRIRDDYVEAMHTLILLLREKAESVVDPQRAALLEQAATLEKRARIKE